MLFYDIRAELMGLVVGAWVRYLIGQETNGQPVYRICQVNSAFYGFI